MDDSLRATADKMKWFHSLDLGAFQTSGRFPPGTPQNRTLFPVMDLLQQVNFSGLDCLDVGTAHGLTAFGMALRGARSVTATDIMESMSPPWALARRALCLEIEYVTNTTFENIPDRLGDRKFDVVVCAGVIYHMLNPFDAVSKCRRLLKPKGLLVLESAYLPNEQRAILDFNPESSALKEVYTYWMPSRSTILGMLRLCGFNPLAERSISNPDRLAVIASNVSWAEVQGKSEMCRRMHEIGLQAGGIAAEPEGPDSRATYTGALGVAALNWETYIPDWRPHPIEMRDVVGQSPWLSLGKNF